MCDILSEVNVKHPATILCYYCMWILAIKEGKLTFAALLCWWFIGAGPTGIFKSLHQVPSPCKGRNAHACGVLTFNPPKVFVPLRPVTPVMGGGGVPLCLDVC